ncbi:hypothetical protein CLV80_102380 [Yoonia maritima]|uniref:Uncharacterized protein n=2 Tax=Yoonia maritima TaxID=1435347 RepID=A0A2T0W3F0_9RHOB|nr:hypothetical protein CLV80_102380 [Yoonia maritima]
MAKLSFTEHNTQSNIDRSVFRDAVLFLLNRMNTELMLLSKSSKLLTGSQFRVATALCMTACQTGTNISRLVDPISLCSKDALPLARTFYESCLNACWHLADDGQHASKSELYTVYKSYKTQKQHYSLGKTSGFIEREPKMDRNLPIVQRAINTFEPNGSSSKVKKCFDITRAQMLNEVGEVSRFSAILLEGCENMNWENASEIAHGSFYGFELLQAKNRSSVDPFAHIENFIVTNASYVVVACADAVARMARAKVTNLSNAKHVSDAAKLFYQEEIPELAEKIETLS